MLGSFRGSALGAGRHAARRPGRNAAERRGMRQHHRFLEGVRDAQHQAFARGAGGNQERSFVGSDARVHGAGLGRHEPEREDDHIRLLLARRPEAQFVRYFRDEPQRVAAVVKEFFRQ